MRISYFAFLVNLAAVLVIQFFDCSAERDLDVHGTQMGPNQRKE